MLKLYCKAERVEFKWIGICRRSIEERPDDPGLLRSARRVSFIVIYIRFPWKVWQYSIENDRIEHEHPIATFWLRWICFAPFGSKFIRDDVKARPHLYASHS